MKAYFKSLALALLLGPQPASAEEAAPENASNPLAKGRNTDAAYQALDLGDDQWRQIAYVEGAFMAAPTLKVKYEVQYQRTNVAGSSERGFERIAAKGIWFPKEGRRGELGYRLALGFEWILDGGNADVGIGSGADQLGPFVGVALAPRPGTTVIPLVQHYQSYRGADVSTTATRLIVVQGLSSERWVKADVIVPVDWENDRAVPAGSGWILPLLSVRMFIGAALAPIIFSSINSMFADIADEHELETGERREGIIFSARSFTQKATGAFGVVVGGAILDLIEFPKGARAGTVAEDVIWNLGFFEGPATSIFTIAGVLFYLGYRIDRNRHAEILASLELRSGETSADLASESQRLDRSDDQGGSKA